MSQNKNPYIPLSERRGLLGALYQEMTKKESERMDKPLATGPQYRDVPFSCRKVEGKGDRVRRFLGSDETPDRYDTVLAVDGWRLENFRKNPVFLWAHNGDNAVPQFPIGRVLLVEPTRVNERGMEDRAAGKKKALAFDVEFYSGEKHPTADLVLDLFDKSFLNAVSVGFQTLKGRRLKNEEERVAYGFAKDNENAALLEENELLELSAVPVPGNPNALIERMRLHSPTAARVFNTAPESTPAWWATKFDELRKAIEAEKPKPAEVETFTFTDNSSTITVPGFVGKSDIFYVGIETPQRELWRGVVTVNGKNTEIALITEDEAASDSEEITEIVMRLTQAIHLDHNVPHAAPCDECDLALALGARCSTHTPVNEVENTQRISELAERFSKLESEVLALRGATPAGGVQSGPSPARSYIEDLLEEVASFEKLNGNLPKIK